MNQIIASSKVIFVANKLGYGDVVAQLAQQRLLCGDLGSFWSLF